MLISYFYNIVIIVSSNWLGMLLLDGTKYDHFDHEELKK